jgi:hypothetical protein
MAAVNHSDMCCPEIVAAGADITAIQRDIEDNQRQAEKWRAEHEHREEGQFNLMMSQLVSIQGEQAEMRKMLANRLPLWATLALSSTVGIVGLLLGVVWELGRIVRGG